MSQIITATQGDTLDAICSRYYGSISVSMLPALISANPDLVQVFIDENTTVLLPDVVEAKQNQTLKLWD